MKNVLFGFKSTFLIFLQSCSLTVLSQQPQDYQLFRQDAAYFYHSADDSYPHVVGLRLDSAVITEDGTEYYNHESIFEEFISPEMYWCIKPDGPSWMDLRGMEKGVYLLRVRSGERFTVKKIVH